MPKMPKPDGKAMLENTQKMPQDRALLAKATNEEKAERAKKCAQEIKGVLEKYDFAMGAQPVVVPGQGGLFMLAAQPLLMPRDGKA